MTAPSVLLVGGNGFLGQALARALSSTGWQVGVLSRGEMPCPLPGVEWHGGSQDDPGVVAALLDMYGAVVHLASTSTPGTYADRPARECEENLLPLLRFLEISEGRPEVPLIFISSGGAIYGQPTELPVGESQRLAPISNHAAGKAAAECFLGVQAARGRRVTVLRPSNVYGPGQHLKPGFGVIRTMLEHARRGTAMAIWGDGETLRDYLYVDDFVEAMRRVLEAPTVGTFNLGSGVGVSLNALCRLAERVTARPIRTAYHPARGVDVRAVVLDGDAFQQRYGWQPHIALDEGLRRTWEWLASGWPIDGGKSGLL
jgi:UDP-glucose 4-epimerase